jgi:hypothetical protein
MYIHYMHMHMHGHACTSSVEMMGHSRFGNIFSPKHFEEGKNLSKCYWPLDVVTFG